MSYNCLMRLFQSVTDLSRDSEALRRRRYGVIEIVEGGFRRILLRPFPTILVGPEVIWLGQWMHQRARATVCCCTTTIPGDSPISWP